MLRRSRESHGGTKHKDITIFDYHAPVPLFCLLDISKRI